MKNIIIFDLDGVLIDSRNNMISALKLTNKTQDVIVSNERKKAKYTPLSKRKDRPDSVLWLVKNFSQLSDGQVAKMVGSTKSTVGLIRNRTYWNFSNLTAKDPVILGLCSQLQFEKAVEKAESIEDIQSVTNIVENSKGTFSNKIISTESSPSILEKNI